MPYTFNFHSFFLQLTGATPTTNVTQSLTAAIQGSTQVTIDWSKIAALNKPAWKILINWDNSPLQIISPDYSSTYSVFLSTFSTHLFTPVLSSIDTRNTSLSVFFDNGVIYSWNITFLLLAENTIDLDLNLMASQNLGNLQSIINLQSNGENVLFNSTLQ